MRIKTLTTLGLGVLLAFAGTRTAFADGEDFAFGVPGDAAKVTRTIRIRMLDLSFQPSSVNVKAGETVRFVVTNTSGIDHDFTLGDAKTQAAHRKEMAEMAGMGGDMAKMHDGAGADPNAVFVKAGTTRDLVWTFTKPMALEYDCNIPGHAEAGMKGKIVVR